MQDGDLNFLLLLFFTPCQNFTLSESSYYYFHHTVEYDTPSPCPSVARSTRCSHENNALKKKAKGVEYNI